MTLLAQLKDAFAAATPPVITKLRQAATATHRGFDTLGWPSDGVRSQLRLQGFTVHLYNDSGEPFTFYSGWDEEGATGVCGEFRIIYLQAVKAAETQAEHTAPAVLTACQQAARAGRRQVKARLPGVSYGYGYECTAFSRRLTELLQAEGLTITKPNENGWGYVSGWS